MGDAVREMALVFDRVHEASEAIHEFVTERAVRFVRKVLGRSADADMPPYLLEEDVEVIKQERRACVSEQVSPPLDSSPLSFFDDFRAVSGIPSFVLDQEVAEKSVNVNSGNLAKKTADNGIVVTVCRFSACTTRLVSGHRNGTLRLWDAQHGFLIHELREFHYSAVADVAFWGDSDSSILSISVSGVLHFWRIGRHTPFDAKEIHSKNDVICERFLFSHRGTVLVCSGFDKKNGTATATIYSLSDSTDIPDCTSNVFQCGEVLCDRLGRIALETDLKNDVLSCVKVSPDKSKTIVCIANSENDRAIGVSYLCNIAGKNGKGNIVANLMGEMGEWGLNCDLIVTWDQVHRCKTRTEDPASPAWVWSIRDNQVEKTTIKDPDFGHIIWCKFYCQESEAPSQSYRPSLATCATGDDKDLRIVLWNSYYLTPTSTKLSWVPVHTMPSGIGAFIGTCPMVSGNLARRKWAGDVSIKGINSVSATEKGSWLGAVSADSKRGVIWNPNHGVTAIQMDFPSVWVRSKMSGEQAANCDLVFPDVGEKRFAVVWDTTIAIMSPRILGEHDAPGAQMLSLKYKDPQVDDTDPSPICKFSSNSESIGLLFPGSDLLNIWDLTKGIRHTVAAGHDHKQFTDFALLHEKQGMMKVATVSIDRKVVLWLISCLNEPFKMELYALGSNHPYPSRAISFVSDTPLLVICERGVGLSPDKLVYVPLDSRPGEGSCYHGSQLWGIASRYRRSIGQALGGKVASPPTRSGGLSLSRTSSIPFAENIQAGHGCFFSFCGKTAIFMPSQNELVVWDLKAQKKVKSIKYKANLGSLGCPFPDNISGNGDFAIAMVGTLSQPVPIRCDPETHLADLPPVVVSNQTRVTLSKTSGNPLKSHWVAISDIESKGSFAKVANTAHQIRLVDINGKSKPKIIKGPNLNTSKVLVISPDGRRVACLADWRKLRVWSAYACEGLLPDYFSLKDDNKSEDLILVQKMLADFGPVLLNLQSYSFVTRAISDLNMRVLSILMAWTLKHGHMIQLRKLRYANEYTGDDKECRDGMQLSQSWNALDIAIQHRSPESLDQIISVIMRGLVPGFEKARIFEESLVKVGELYPKVLQRCLYDEGVFVDVCSLEVKESVFKKFGYQVVYDPRLTAPRSMMQAHWDKHTKFAEGVKIPAVLQSIPYGNAAHARTRGLIKRLLMAKAPNRVYSSPPIRMVLSYKWNEYGKMMTITQFAHFFLLLVCFTTYCFLLGNTHSELSEVSGAGGITQSYGTRARVFLSLSAVLGLISLLCEVKQIVVQVSEDGYRGILHYISSMWNWVEVVSYLMLVLVIPLFHMVHNIGHSIVVAITSIMLWWKLMYFAKTYRRTGPLVIVLEKILQDIAFFLILGFMVVSGFGIAFFVLYRHVRHDPQIQGLRAAGELGSDADMIENMDLAFGSVGRTLLTMLTYMLGDFDLDPIHNLYMPGRLDALSQGKALRNATILVLILYVFSISILLLNLLIAIMADSFQRMKDTEEPEFFHARALAIDDLESMMSEKKKNNIYSRSKDKGPEYIHILRPLSFYNDASSGWNDRYLYGEDHTGNSEMKDIQKILSVVDKQNHVHDKKGLLPDFSTLLSDCEGEVSNPSSYSLNRPEKALGDYYKNYFNRK